MFGPTISEHSRYVEAALEHGFLASLLSHVWGKYPGEEVQVYKSEVDSSGYDLVLNFRGVVRHVQLKSKMISSTTSSFPISEKLREVSGGCVILITYEPSNLSIRDYRFFGFSGPQLLPDLSQMPMAKSPRGNALGLKKQRKSTRKVAQGYFHLPMLISEIAGVLFRL